MTALAPFIVVIGVIGAVALGFVAFWERVSAWLSQLTEPYRASLERAAIRMKAEELVFIVLIAATAPWGLAVAILRPGPVMGILMLGGTSLLAYYGTRMWINHRVAKRLGTFNNQLETVLRLISGALRVGLGLRQSLVTVVADMPDPSRVEFSRVLSQTQIGVGIYDALDQLAERMPSSEMTMLTKAVRVQSQTGGNLTHVLDNLADTIKQRRRIARKVKALTAEAVTTKYIITALPVGVGAFVISCEPGIRHGLLGTMVGWICMAIVVFLLGFGWWLFGQLSRIDV